MKVREIYELAISMGMAGDPRGAEKVREMLSKEKAGFDELKEDDKKDFDREKLVNPYSDTRILTGDPEKKVKRILAGIDMEVGEILLADRLAAAGKGPDLVLSHHPEGKGLAALYQVMHLQEDLLAMAGVPVNVAENIMSVRIGEVKRTLMSLNHNRSVDAAKILGFPLMSVHTPADNLVHDYLQKKIDQRHPETLGDLIKLLKEEPEYADAARQNAGPAIIVGSKDRRTGKVILDMTGGTSGSEDAYMRLVQAGVGTIVGMHMSEKHRKESEKNFINVIIAGHIASDSLGMNIFLDELEERGIEITACSGLMRHKRKAGSTDLR